MLAVHLASHELEAGDLTFGLSLGAGHAARTAASSLPTPLANEATRLVRARSMQGPSPSTALLRMIMWKSAMISRASTRVGTPASMAATVTVSTFERVSLLIVRDEQLFWPRESAEDFSRRPFLLAVCASPIRR